MRRCRVDDVPALERLFTPPPPPPPHFRPRPPTGSRRSTPSPKTSDQSSENKIKLLSKPSKKKKKTRYVYASLVSYGPDWSVPVRQPIRSECSGSRARPRVEGKIKGNTENSLSRKRQPIHSVRLVFDLFLVRRGSRATRRFKGKSKGYLDAQGGK